MFNDCVVSEGSSVVTGIGGGVDCGGGGVVPE